ncbi:nuclear transport factor 2 family protein [uncultured Flavobacterium sp.]|mgnify:FL=1|uniref:nuclear transport factor 2 family protein n=1 Tax=uncultured Flavobacterium sp. TaxID=165435 RepID=UPI0025D2F2FC|nr:nuclear transport factor 2 family protein [uncultured Flavobacterium sp.]
MKKIILVVVASFFTLTIHAQIGKDKDKISEFLDSWHKDASNADFKNYFDKIADDGIYIGTDATENWTKKEFEAFAKPYFDKGKAWDFKVLERNIYFSPDKKLAWFDELLDTQMKICRGSGVLEFKNGKWKIKHYVLSMTIPNDNVDVVIQAKSKIENPLLEKLRKK